MTNAWDSLPNGPLLDELLRNVKLFDNQTNAEYELSSDVCNIGWVAIKALGRESICAEWVRRLNAVYSYYCDIYYLFYDAGLALMAYDEAGELYKQPIDQLKLTVQLLPESDWRHIAAILLLPLKGLLDGKCVG